MSLKTSEEQANYRRIIAGKRLSSPPDGEAIVISGVSGIFPNSDTVDEFISNLRNKVDLCDDEERRFKHTHPEVPRISGKLRNFEDFDAGMFGVSHFNSYYTDPISRLLLQKSFEALLDAGYHPKEIKGSSTAVILGDAFLEGDKELLQNFYNNRQIVLGSLKSIYAQRIAYMLGVNGPAFLANTACSSSLFALETAFRFIREGRCEQAMVVASNIAIKPENFVEFTRLGVLNLNTGCRPFDINAQGYTRSEAVVAFFLQKQCNARRIYTQIVHCKTNSNGFNDDGLLSPSVSAHKTLYSNVYEECGVDYNNIAKIEAHGTGTKTGDTLELEACDQFFCSERKTPVYLGSIKGNMGHAEGSATFCSMLKMINEMEVGTLIPNMNFTQPRPEIRAIMEGRMKVVLDFVPYPTHSDIAVVNSFGFGGANAHCVLKRHNKPKCITPDPRYRMVCYSSRTAAGIAALQNFVETNGNDYELIAFLQNIYKNDFDENFYRGFTIVSKNVTYHSPGCRLLDNTSKKFVYLYLNNAHYTDDQMNTFGAAREWHDLSAGVEAMCNGHNIAYNQLVKSAMAQIFIIEILKASDIKFDNIYGTPVLADYAKGQLGLEHTILLTYYINLAFQNATIYKTKTPLKVPPVLVPIIDKYLQEVIQPKPIDDLVQPNSIVVSLNQPPIDVKGVQNVFMKRDDMSLLHVLQNIGIMYEMGVKMDLTKLYPPVTLPVSSGTPMFASTLKFRNKRYPLERFKQQSGVQKYERTVTIDLSHPEFKFYEGHILGGRNLCPASGYLLMIWQFYAEIHQTYYEHMPIWFESVKFLQGSTFPPNGAHNFYLAIHNDGQFEVTQEDDLLVTGCVKSYKAQLKPFNASNSVAPVPKMSSNDIEKELNLRGYNYKDDFKVIDEMEGNMAKFRWINWVTFIDGFLQFQILHNETRLLQYPIAIESLIIDPQSHLQSCPKYNNLIPVHIDYYTKMMRTDFIEMTSPQYFDVQEKLAHNEPILESFEFVPNVYATNYQTSASVNLQVVLENIRTRHLHCCEILPDGVSDSIYSVFMREASDRITLVLVDLLIEASAKARESIAKKVQGQHIKVQSNCAGTYTVVIGYGLGSNLKNLEHANKLLAKNGYLISIENSQHLFADYLMCTKHRVKDKYIYLLRHKPTEEKIYTAIDVGFNKLDQIEIWLEQIKEALTREDNILLYAQNNDTHGILGLVKCIRDEPNGARVTCVFVPKNAPPFDANHEFYQRHLEKGFAFNVFKDGHWGTYRHLLLDEPHANYMHYKAVCETKGDLKSIKWMRGHLCDRNSNFFDDDLIKVHFCGVNVKDNLIASGKYQTRHYNRMIIDHIQGFEFSGVTKTGQKVMGLAKNALTNYIGTKKAVYWNIPNDWSLNEAGTIPYAYSLSLFALLKKAHLRENMTILIHSKGDPITQAAVAVCKYYKCKIYVTVKDYAQKKYLELEDACIGLADDIKLLERILIDTKDAGVDIMLNILGDDDVSKPKIQPLKTHGCYIDIECNGENQLSLDMLQKSCLYSSVQIDSVFHQNDLWELFQAELKKGYIKPLHYFTYDKEQIQDAFRNVMHETSKVLVSLQPDRVFSPLPRFYCNPNASYIIIGGLGGFGLELIDWLILRGAKTIVISVRRLITIGYQRHKIRLWKSYGIDIHITLCDIKTKQGCEVLLNEANELAPVAGIFNLAAVLRDAIIENQTAEMIIDSLMPKLFATQHLDELSRRLCPQLEHFVVFSSISSGKGNAGQSNYGLSNSSMERICERRRADGYPALAIQWGPIADVGMLTHLNQDNNKAIAGSLPQKMSNCLSVLDHFLLQNKPVVSSFVMAEKHEDGDNIISIVSKALMIKDMKSVSQQSTLAELGMDSLQSIEIRRILEQNYGVQLPLQDIKSMSIAKLSELDS